jgi:hypothetical protein
MMRLRWIVLLTCAGLLSVTPLGGAAAEGETAMVAAPSERERQPDAVFEFAKTLCWRNDRDRALAYVMDGVQIPEIREKTRIGHLQVVPSTKKGVRILLAHFEDETLKGDRLAFIWEVAVKNDRITRIQVLYDGANPLTDEARLIREYQLKYKRDVLVPTEFPFEITHFDGYIEPEGSIVLVYRNAEMNGFFRVIASPIAVELDRYKGKHDVNCQLKDGTKALYRPKFELGYELRFQKDGLQYTLAIGNKKSLTKKFKADDLLKAANGLR